MTSLRTPVCEQFGIEQPIFGFAHDISPVAAICNAGGLGVYGATRRFPDEIRNELAEIRRLVGDRPFGVDLVLPPGMPEHNSRESNRGAHPRRNTAASSSRSRRSTTSPSRAVRVCAHRFIRSSEIEQEQLEAVFESDVDLFACGIGAPRAAVDRAHELGKLTAALIGSPRHVHRALNARRRSHRRPGLRRRCAHRTHRHVHARSPNRRPGRRHPGPRCRWGRHGSPPRCFAGTRCTGRVDRHDLVDVSRTHRPHATCTGRQAPRCDLCRHSG